MLELRILPTSRQQIMLALITMEQQMIMEGDMMEAMEEMVVAGVEMEATEEMEAVEETVAEEMVEEVVEIEIIWIDIY